MDVLLTSVHKTEEKKNDKKKKKKVQQNITRAPQIQPDIKIVE